jgi:YD repeat-containing protein
MTTSYATAVGRTIARSTWQGATRLEHATFTHDRLGHQTGMTRYQDAVAGANPVTSSWHFDSLGQVVELDEPDSVPQLNTYSSWGELLRVRRYMDPGSGGSGGSGSGSGSGSGGGDGPGGPGGGGDGPGGPGGGGDGPPSLSLDTGTNTVDMIKRYDALGRVIHSEQHNNGIADPATVNDYLYDQAIKIAPQVTPTNMLGRLAQAISPTGAVSFSYDAFGQINARVFTDPWAGCTSRRTRPMATVAPRRSICSYPTPALPTSTSTTSTIRQGEGGRCGTTMDPTGKTCSRSRPSIRSAGSGTPTTARPATQRATPTSGAGC